MVMFYFFGETKFTHAQLINIIYALDSHGRNRCRISVGQCDKKSRTCSRHAAADSDVKFKSHLFR